MTCSWDAVKFETQFSDTISWNSELLCPHSPKFYFLGERLMEKLRDERIWEVSSPKWRPVTSPIKSTPAVHITTHKWVALQQWVVSAHARSSVRHSGNLLDGRFHSSVLCRFSSCHSFMLFLRSLQDETLNVFVWYSLFFSHPIFPFHYASLCHAFFLAVASYVPFWKKIHLPWRLRNYICDIYLSCHLNVDMLTLTEWIKQISSNNNNPHKDSAK